MSNFDLKNRIILATVAGSRAYGMNTSTSDLDVKGVFVPTLSYYFGTKKIEQIDDKKQVCDTLSPFLSKTLEKVANENGMEGTVYEVRRFLDLASGANPNILDILFCRDSDVILTSVSGDLLRKNKDKFLTKKCLQTFLGYATAQAKRIEGHRKWLLDPPDHEPTRSEFGLPDRNNYPQDQVIAAMDSVKKQVDRWNIDFVDTDEATKIFIQDQMYKMLAEINVGSDEMFNAAGRILGIETNFMDLVHKQRKYTQAVDEWSSFQSWKNNRNKQRQGMEATIGYDCKHGAHLYRLTIACKTIFETGTLQVYNPDPYLMKIRNGEVPYQELLEKFSEQKETLSKIAAKSSLPTRVNSEWLENLSIEIVTDMCKNEVIK